MSWPQVPIGEFCRTGSGGTPSRDVPEYYDGTIPWIKSGDLREKTVEQATEFITELAVQKSSAKIVPAGAVLLAMYGATVGRMAMLGIDAATNQAVCSIVPDEKRAFTKYVYYALLAKVPEFLRNAVGGAQPNISQGMIKETKIPLPPLAEQKRIAAILDKADAIRRKRQQAIQLADEFLRAVFLDMFGDPVTNPKGWDVASVGSLCDVQGGLQVTNKREVLVIEKPYLRVANVLRNRLDLSEIKTIKLTEAEFNRVKLKRNDLLVVEGHGNRNEIGRSAIWDGSIEDVVHQNHLIRIRVRDKKLESRFLNDFINSPAGRTQMLGASNTTSGLNTISTNIVKDTKIFVPNLKLQGSYVSIVERLNKLLKSNFLSAGELDLSFKSISQMAFSGQL